MVTEPATTATDRAIEAAAKALSDAATPSANVRDVVPVQYATAKGGSGVMGRAATLARVAVEAAAPILTAELAARIAGLERSLVELAAGSLGAENIELRLALTKARAEVDEWKRSYAARTADFEHSQKNCRAAIANRKSADAENHLLRAELDDALLYVPLAQRGFLRQQWDRRRGEQRIAATEEAMRRG